MFVSSERQTCVDKKTKLQVRDAACCVRCPSVRLSADVCCVSLLRSSLEIPEINAMTLNPRVSSSSCLPIMHHTFDFSVWKSVLKGGFTLSLWSLLQDNSLVVGAGDNKVHILDLEHGAFKVGPGFCVFVLRHSACVWTSS